MKTKIFYILICLLFGETSVWAQNDNNTTLYPRIGVNLSSFTKGVAYSLDDEAEVYYKPRYAVGFHVGGEVQKKI